MYAGRHGMTTMEWMRTEFAAANAIIDELCGHLVQIGGRGPDGYEAVLQAVNRRRVTWLPVIHMHKYFPILDVYTELNRVADKKRSTMQAINKGVVEEGGGGGDGVEKMKKKEEEEEEEEENRKRDCACSVGDSSDQKQTVLDDGTASGDYSQEESASEETALIFSEDGEYPTQTERTKNCKRFAAKETVKGHMVNVVKGLKVYEDILTDTELSRLDGFINELRVAGRSGELSGDTYILFNKQLKGNKKEVIQLGVPMFQPTTEESTSNIEPIPSVLQDLINHLVQWRLIPENKRPNSCIINFFDEDDHSQPYLKPPHLENPISTLVLRETEMAFGRALVSDQHGDFKGSLRLSLKEGSLLVMRGHSADMARHVICPSPKSRASITFAKVRLATMDHCMQSNQMATILSPTSAVVGGGPLVPEMVPAWGMGMAQQIQAPIFTVAPAQSNAMNPITARSRRGGNQTGTGVFLPWTVGPKRHVKQLPPRIQKGRLPPMPPHMEMQMEMASQQIPCFAL